MRPRGATARKRGFAMDKTALLVIDAQQEYFAPIGRVVLPDGPPAVERIADLLAWARTHGVPVVHVVHESRRPNPTTPSKESNDTASDVQQEPAAKWPIAAKYNRIQREVRNRAERNEANRHYERERQQHPTRPKRGYAPVSNMLIHVQHSPSPLNRHFRPLFAISGDETHVGPYVRGRMCLLHGWPQLRPGARRVQGERLTGPASSPCLGSTSTRRSVRSRSDKS